VERECAVAVHTHDSKIKVLPFIFQARYADGYNLLDRSGQLLNHLQREHPRWQIVRAVQPLITLRNPESRITANIGLSALDLTSEGNHSLPDAEKLCRTFGDACEFLYGLVVEQLSLSTTTRVGVRYQFLAPADSLEEADKAMTATLASPYQAAATKALGMDVVDGYTVLVADDRETGLRRRFAVLSFIADVPAGTPEWTGLGNPEGSGGLLVDIDAFTRPATGHYAKCSLFIQEQFLKSRQISSITLKWIIGQ
jgi:hypothetical protein